MYQDLPQPPLRHARGGRKTRRAGAEAEAAAGEFRAIAADVAHEQACRDHQVREALTYLCDWSYSPDAVQRAAVILRAAPGAPAVERLFGVKL